MAQPWIVLGAVWAISSFSFALLWVWCQRIQNASYIDVAWATVIGGALPAAAGALSGNNGRFWLVAVMGVLWSSRLSAHLYKRIHGKPEDGRYAHMRQAFGSKAPAAFFIFFQMQAVFVVMFLAPMVSAMTRPGVLDWRDAVGLGIFLVAMVGEWIADQQLARFKARPANKDKVCNVGLWRYSRHPNYFFEWVHWFAYLAIGARFSESIGYAAIAGPIVMLVFLVFVTGIPYTEMRAVQSKGEAYKQYQRETSAFFPWFPKKAAQA